MFFVSISSVGYIAVLIIHSLLNLTESSGKHHYLYSVVDFHSDSMKSSIVCVIIFCIGYFIFFIMAAIKTKMINNSQQNKRITFDELQSSV